MEKISSSSNQKFKHWSSLLSSKGLKKSEDFLVSGEAWLDELVNLHSDKLVSLIYPGGTESKYPKHENKSFVLDKELFNKIDEFGTKAPIGIFKKSELKSWHQAEKLEGFSLLCPLGDPSNLGALLRNAAAFEVKNIILLKESVSPFHPKTVRTAAGNIFNFQFFSGPSIHDLEASRDMFCLDAKGQSLSSFHYPKDFLLLVGEEGPGIPQSLRAEDQCLAIPMSQKVESLNAYFASSLVMYEYFKSK